MESYLTLILFGGSLTLLILGAPITVSLAGASMAAYMLLDKNPIALVQIAFTSVGNFLLMALPALFCWRINGGAVSPNVCGYCTRA